MDIHKKEQRAILKQRLKDLEQFEKNKQEVDICVKTITNDDLLYNVLNDFVGDDYDGGRTNLCQYRLNVFYPELIDRLKENKFITEDYVK